MERVGFFTTEPAEAIEALTEQVLGKGRFGAPAGLEIAPAGPNPGVGAGLRRMQATVRLDIPMLWRALIRRPEGKKDGPIVTLLAPRGTAADTAGPKLVEAGIGASNMVASADGFDCMFPPDTPPDRLVGFAVQALQAIGGLGTTGEWQWSVRPKGQVPS